MKSPDLDSTLAWLLETEAENPGVRYFAFQDLLGRPKDDAEVVAARGCVMETGPVPKILAAQLPDGSWGRSDWKYTSTVWQVALLAELGADPQEPRVQLACEYVLKHQHAASGGFTFLQPPRPSDVVHCGSGIVVHALLRLGRAADARLQAAVDWQARAIIGEDSGLRYYKSGTSSPNFGCAVNLGQPCAWGANKALKGLLSVPPEHRTADIRRALEVAADFLLSRDPAMADYPYTERVSSTWFRLGFPLSYWSDVLETTEVLVELGYGQDLRLANVFELILRKRDEQGRWRLENSLNGKTWVDIEEKGKPSKWVTLRALRVLQRAGRPGLP
jgi:hypothetical protein